jgi:hypothetical protein
MACKDFLRGVVGDAFSDEQIDEMLDRLASRAKRLGMAEPDLEYNQALRKAAKELTAEDLKAKIINRRAAAFAEVAKMNRALHFEGETNNLGKRFQELMVGSSRLQAKTGLSTDARGRAQGDIWRNQLVMDLEKIDGALDRLSNWIGKTDRDFEKEVAHELSRLNGAKIAPSKDAMAGPVAAALKAAQDKVFDGLNATGAYLSRLPGYITKQDHDPLKISGGFWRGMGNNAEKAKLHRQAWIDYILPRLDETTFAPVDERVYAQIKANGLEFSPAALRTEGVVNSIEIARRDFLENVWSDIVLGKNNMDDLSDLDSLHLPAGLANKVSRARVLHFKDANSWLEYHSEFGSGSFLETFMRGIDKGARNKALMEVWGPNPKAAWEAERTRRIDEAVSKNEIKAAEFLRDGGREREFAVLDGSVDGPRGGGEARASAVGQALRVQQSLAKLGGMTLTSISDIGASATALVRAGVPIFSAYSDILSGITRLQGDDAVKAADLVGVASRAMIGDIAGNFSAHDGGVASIRKLENAFYKVNGFELWQTGVRRGVSAALTKLLGNNSELAFDALEGGMRTQLERFGIDAPLWDLIRASGVKIGDDGAKYITPDIVQNLDNDALVKWQNPPKQTDTAKVTEARKAINAAFEKIGEPEKFETFARMDEDAQALLQSIGVNEAAWNNIRAQGLENTTNKTLAKYLAIDDVWTDTQKLRAKDEAQIRLQSWFSAFVDDALTEPRAAEKAAMTWGTRDGTAMGVIIRLATQFKSFPYTFVTRNILPTGREFASTYGAVARGEAPVEALGRPAMMAANTLVGMTVLGYVAGAMKDLVAGKEPRPIDRPETWMAAFVQGGGAGFYGDFLVSQYNREGQGPLAALLGPSIGSAEQILSMYGKLRDGDDDVGASAMKFGIANVPFANLFYLRAALNYGMLYNMQEYASPGYLARMEERMQEKEGRGFMVEPQQLSESYGAR